MPNFNRTRKWDSIWIQKDVAQDRRLPKQEQIGQQEHQAREEQAVQHEEDSRRAV